MPGRALYEIVWSPVGFVRDQLDTIRWPPNLTRMKQIFTCNDVYINIKIHYHSIQWNRLSRKDWSWFWQWWRWKPHLLKTAKISMPLVRCILFILSYSSEIYTFVRGLFEKFVENVYKIVSIYSILLVFAYNTGQYVYDRHCKFLFNLFIRKKVTHVLLTKHSFIKSSILLIQRSSTDMTLWHYWNRLLSLCGFCYSTRVSFY